MDFEIDFMPNFGFGLPKTKTPQKSLKPFEIARQSLLK